MSMKRRLASGQHGQIEIQKTLGQLLCVQNGEEFWPHGLRPAEASDIIIRREKQRFFQLKSVTGIAFSVPRRRPRALVVVEE